MSIASSLPADILIKSEQIKRLQSSSSIEHNFSVIWAPRRTVVSDKIFEESGVLGDVNIEVYPLHFVPLERDLLSLCIEDAFNDLYLVSDLLQPSAWCLQFAKAKDPTCIYLTALALMPLQHAFGLFPRIIGKGDNAHRLMELLLRMRSEAAAEETNTSRLGMMPSASIDSLIIIDRGVDLATPLLTQLTYEGLIDEHFGIKDNQAEIDSSIVGPAPGTKQIGKEPVQQSLKRKIQLDSSDALYAQLRDTNFAIVDSLINKVARRLQADYESRHKAQTTSELGDFVKKLPGFLSEQASLKTHIGLTEEILKHTSSELFRRVLEVQQNFADGTDPSSQHETIEELIARNLPLPTLLRLACLESVISGGLRQKDLDNFKRLILHAYGYQHLLTLHNLEKIGLLSTRSSASVLFNPISVGAAAAAAATHLSDHSSSGAAKTNYNYLRKILRLIVDEVNEQNPNDISYVYSGYAPLSVRLVQAVVQKQHLLSITRGGLAPAPAPATTTTSASSAAPTSSSPLNPNQPPPTTHTNSHPTSSSTAHGWQGFDDALRNIRGETFNKVQKGEDAAVKARSMLMSGSNSGGGAGAGGGAAGKHKTILVMFLGGITFTEIAALRFVGRQLEEESGGGGGGGGTGGGRRLVICTTGIISGESIMRDVIEKGDFGKG